MTGQTIFPKHERWSAWAGTGSGFIDRAGQWIVRPVYAYARPFSEGLALVQLGGTHSAWGGGKRGFIDQSGRVVIALQFDEARSFSDGVAAVGIDRKWGFVDKAGKITVPPQFDRVWDFSRGLAQVVVEQNGRREYLYIDTRGRVVWRNTRHVRSRVDITSIVAEIVLLTFYSV